MVTRVTREGRETRPQERRQGVGGEWRSRGEIEETPEEKRRRRKLPSWPGEKVVGRMR